MKEQIIFKIEKLEKKLNFCLIETIHEPNPYREVTIHLVLYLFFNFY